MRKKVHKPSVGRDVEIQWLIRLRWVILLSQAAICVVSALWLGIEIPVMIVGSALALEVILNACLIKTRNSRSKNLQEIITAVIFIDVILLTIMLFFLGGAHNPFTLFYLLYVVIAVVLLSSPGAWGAVALSTLGFWILFHSNYPLQGGGETCCTDIGAHLRGMVIAMLITGSILVYFMNLLSSGLHRAELELNELRREGEQNRQRMELATLVAGIVHEMATPLATIAVVSKDMMENEPSEVAEDAQEIRREVERCHKIMQRLGQLGATPYEEEQQIKLWQLHELLESYLPPRLFSQLTLEIDQSPRSVKLPLHRLLQCLAILIKNAVEASPPKRKVELWCGIRGNQLQFIVSDEGEGFSQSVLESLGELMVTTKQSRGGLGLGLYLVKAFAKDQGGELKIEPRQNGGSKVSLCLPLQ